MGRPKRITATGQVIDPENDAGKGVIYGVVVNAHTNGKLRLVDSPGGASGADLFGSNANPFTFNTSLTSLEITIPAPINFVEGVYAEVTGTLDCDLIWSPKTE